MPVFHLTNEIIFPSVSFAEPDGLLALGGDLSTERILYAYSNGIFPWYSGVDILWWSPDPRFVLFPEEIKVSKSMEKVIRNEEFSFSVNRDFEKVIAHCKSINRPGQDGTWITKEMQRAYTRLHAEGYAFSAEAWRGDELVGGLYGLRIGSVFFGESMFSRATNASKFAFISYVQQLKKEGVLLIDCQVYTTHLESLGAELIPRETFMEMLKEYVR